MANKGCGCKSERGKACACKGHSLLGKSSQRQENANPRRAMQARGERIRQVHATPDSVAPLSLRSTIPTAEPNARPGRIQRATKRPAVKPTAKNGWAVRRASIKAHSDLSVHKRAADRKGRVLPQSPRRNRPFNRTRTHPTVATSRGGRRFWPYSSPANRASTVLVDGGMKNTAIGKTSIQPMSVDGGAGSDHHAVDSPIDAQRVAADWSAKSGAPVLSHGGASSTEVVADIGGPVDTSQGSTPFGTVDERENARRGFECKRIIHARPGEFNGADVQPSLNVMMSTMGDGASSYVIRLTDHIGFSTPGDDTGAFVEAIRLLTERARAGLLGAAMLLVEAHPTRADGSWLVATPIGGGPMINFRDIVNFRVVGRSATGSVAPLEIRVSSTDPTGSSTPVFAFQRCQNFSVRNIRVDGNRAARGLDGSRAAQGPWGENAGTSYLFLVRDCSRVDFRNVEAVNGPSVGILVDATNPATGGDPTTGYAGAFPSGFNFRNCRAINCAYLGIAIAAGWQVRIIGGEYSYTNMLSTKAGISLEAPPDVSPGNPLHPLPAIKDVIIHGVLLQGNWKGIHLNARGGTRDITVEECTFIGTPAGVSETFTCSTTESWSILWTELTRGGSCGFKTLGPGAWVEDARYGIRASGINVAGANGLLIQNNSFMDYGDDDKVTDGIINILPADGRWRNESHVCVIGNSFTSIENSHIWRLSAQVPSISGCLESRYVTRCSKLVPIMVWPCAGHVWILKNSMTLFPATTRVGGGSGGGGARSYYVGESFTGPFILNLNNEINWTVVRGNKTNGPQVESNRRDQCSTDLDRSDG